jgi:hypothetical protein
MSLTQMQDIGGCRAIMPTVADALALVALYLRPSSMKAKLLKSPNDYVASPKDDGYRSVHLVYKYHTDSLRYKIFEGHRIEIQIRSFPQHIWATAVEMLLTFTGIPIRAPVGAYNALPRDLREITQWRQFFKLMANAIAEREGQPSIPSTPTGLQLLYDLRHLAYVLNVADVLTAWSKLIGWHEMRNDRQPGTLILEGSQFLLQLDPITHSLNITPFEDSRLAFNAYMEAEKNSRQVPSTNIVLVAVDSLEQLREAYPNYYGDTAAFISLLNEIVR